MRDKLLQYKGPYGEQRNPVSDELISYEPLRERSEVYNYEITEHLHADLMQIFLITEGGGILLSEGKKITLQTPCAIIIPNNTLHGFVFQSNVRGDVFTFTNNYFENNLTKAKNRLDHLFELQHFIFENNTNSFNRVVQIKNNLVIELAANQPEKNYAVQLQFQSLLLQLYRLKIVKPTQTLPTENKTLIYFRAFQKMIKHDIHETKTIQGYAQELNLSTVHLNRVCQAVVQKSALQVVHEYLIIEAKKYLLGTSNSIAQISYFLNFKDPSHFSKFFGKMVGTSPKRFRKKGHN